MARKDASEDARRSTVEPLGSKVAVSEASPLGRRRGATKLLLSAQFLRYLVQGVGINVVWLIIFSVLTLGLPESPPLTLNLTTSLLVFPLSYVIYRRWVFRSSDALGPQIKRFMIVALSTILANATMLALLLTLLPWPVLTVQLLVTATLVVGSFLVNAMWAFAPRSPASDPLQ